MSDSYQAIYEAVRSKITGGNVTEAIEQGFRDSGFGHYAEQAFRHISDAGDELFDAAREQQRPFVLLKPRVFIDGDLWCALYGENLQDGVAGFGNSPKIASESFDKEWLAKLKEST